MQNISDESASWDQYWAQDSNSPAFSDNGVNHDDVRAYWERVLSWCAEHTKSDSLLDIATGNGALLDQAVQHYGAKLQYSCLDVSAAAIRNVTLRYPDVKGIVSSADDLPEGIGQFSIVTSQFGVEYAGRKAIQNLPGLVAKGGVLSLLLHSQGSVIDQECKTNQEVIEKTLELNFVGAALDLFSAGFKALKGADRAAYDQAGTVLNQVLPEVEALLTQYGAQAANGTLQKLYSDVAMIHEGLPRYDEDQVLGWLKQMQTELELFVLRMRSMQKAALNPEDYAALLTSLEAAGFRVQEQGILHDSVNQQPLAWQLLALREANDNLNERN